MTATYRLALSCPVCGLAVVRDVRADLGGSAVEQARREHRAGGCKPEAKR